jgi:cobalt-zinc-cadmium efflux system membrane fusion protein
MRAILLLFLLFSSGQALAHGGEDHSEAPAPIASSDGLVASATGSAFEVVIKSSPIQPNKESTLRLMLSDFETNEPIQNATINLDLKGTNFKTKVSAKSTKTPGIYEFTATFPAEGDYTFDLAIEANKKADLLVVNGFALKPLVSDAQASQSLFWITGSGIAVIFLLLGFGLGRIGRKQKQEAL